MTSLIMLLEAKDYFGCDQGEIKHLYGAGQEDL